MKHLISLRGLTITLLLICCNAVWAYDIEVNGIYYNILSASSLTVEVTSGDNKYSGDIVIPSTITYKSRVFTVASIGERAFNYCMGLTSVTIPNSVTSIGESAFNYCRGLTSVVIPNSVTSIGGCAFLDCTGLTSITIPNSVTSIEGATFRRCTGLTSITIPNSVTSIEGCAFYDCTGLTSITIPNSVTIIKWDAFNGCSGLTSVVIPKSVKQTGTDVFKDCSNLKSIYVMSETAPSVSSTCFTNKHYIDAVVYVPNGCLEAYQKADVWKKFWDIREFDPTGIDDVKIENENVTTVYDLNGRVVENPTKGIYIINGKKVLLK